MMVMLFAPDRAAAVRMAKRLLPGSRIVRLEERPDPADQQNLKAFWSAIQQHLHPPDQRRPARTIMRQSQ